LEWRTNEAEFGVDADAVQAVFCDVGDCID
jgi:hypothetical protein